MTDKDERLEPCPFCGSGTFDIRESRMPPTMKGEGSLISAALYHWCTKRPGVVASFVTFRGRERAAAIAAWNSRVSRTEDQQ